MVIAAKNAEALRVMNEKIKNDEIRKFYLCAVHGKMPKRSDTLTAYLKKNSADNLVTVSDKAKDGYKNIITKYRVVSETRENSLLEVDLVTGRTHQIRAHMAHIGHSLIGDGKYGVNRSDREQGYKYQALYSYRLIFDFKSDSGCLDYLTGKQVSIDPEDVWFLADFPDSIGKVRAILANGEKQR
jgi:23S rRNA pseudouridine955/2504/2580 synthase